MLWGSEPLWANDYAAAVALLADKSHHRAVAIERQILPAEPRQRRYDNPEYRIAQDLRVATDAPVDFVVGVVSAALSAATFITVLWTIGGALTLSISGVSIIIPGFLVVSAVIYSAVARGLMMTIGRRFVTVSESMNQAEADFRYALTRVRENGESIALLGGEAEERAGLDRSFGEVLGGWRQLLGQHMRTTFVSQG